MEHMSRREHFGLLVFAAFAQATISVGLLLSNVRGHVFWGVWFAVSAVACLWFAFDQKSVWAMRVSAVGIVCGGIGRGVYILVMINQGASASPGAAVARGTLAIMVGVLSFIVWVRLLAPNNGAARAEDVSGK